MRVNLRKLFAKELLGDGLARTRKSLEQKRVHDSAHHGQLLGGGA